MTRMAGMHIRRPSMLPSGRQQSASGHQSLHHLPPAGRAATDRPSTGINRVGSDSSSGGRRGNWITDTSSKSAAPDEAAVRRILAEPSAYATRPATAGSSNAVRPVGGQRMVDSGVTRALEQPQMECARCPDLQKTIKNLKLKLLEYRNRSEVPLSTRLNTDLDAEVDALRCERDALKGIIDCHRAEDPSTQLEEENRRLLKLIADMRQKLDDMQDEHAATSERLSAQVRMSKADLQKEKQISRDHHAQIFQKLLDSALHAEGLQAAIEKCRLEYVRQKTDSDAQHAEIVSELRNVKNREAEGQRCLDKQIYETCVLEKENTRLLAHMQEVVSSNVDLGKKIVVAETKIQGLSALLDKACKEVAVLMASCRKGNTTLESELSRLKGLLNERTLKLESAEKILQDKQTLIDKMADDIAQLQSNISKSLLATENAQNATERSERDKEVLIEELKEHRDKLLESEALLEAQSSRLSSETSRADGLEAQITPKDKMIATLKTEIEKLQADLAAKTSEKTGTKVVVVTPKITVSLPDGTAHDFGKMNLPKHVLQELVATQLGYTPDELFQVNDISELGPVQTQATVGKLKRSESSTKK